MSDIQRNEPWGPRDALYDENTMLREHIGALERELAEAKRSDVAQAIRASKAEAEVERAREDGFMNGFSGAWYSDGKYDEQYAAAWSRYQQEREGERAHP